MATLNGMKMRTPTSVSASSRPVAKPVPTCCPSCMCSSCRGVSVRALALAPSPRQEGISVRQANFSTNATAVATAGPRVENEADLNQRHHNVSGYFPSALGVDDFMARVEVALSGFGFTGENSIAMTNLCRDEVTTVLKDKIESVFGGSFNTNGLGAVLTCGVTGMGAGFSHSPVSNGKEHYVFFAFPHIGINSAGEVGAITRPGRPVKSCACGALQKCLIELKAEGYSKNCKVPGVHDPLDPEYSILKQRLARRVRYENIDPTKMDLVSITGLAERTITNKAVDFKKANIAVVTGVQIHNWATELDARSGVPSLEFVAPAKVFVVVDGRKTFIDLSRVPTMSPRQLQLMAKASVSGHKDEDQVAIGKTVAGTLKEIPLKYLTQRLGVTKDPEELTMPGMSYTW
ncbi:LCIB_C_CA domain-containing protein, partial [Haematococcus lacustris]